MDLRGAVALVTGGSGGLGSRICDLLAAEGADVAVGYCNGEERALQVKRAAELSGRRACCIHLDQKEPTSVQEAVDKVVRELGGLDILVNNAGIAMGGHKIDPGDLDAFTPEIWDEMMSVNVRGPYLVARAAAPHLRASKWGRIVSIGSTVGLGDWYADRPFAPSKASVVPLTRFLAASMAPDVTVNCVAPGVMIDTGLGGREPEENYSNWTNRAALGKTTSIDDVAGQVVFLCTTSAVTGQCIAIDGGINFH